MQPGGILANEQAGKKREGKEILVPKKPDCHQKLADNEAIDEKGKSRDTICLRISNGIGFGVYRILFVKCRMAETAGTIAGLARANISGLGADMPEGQC